MIPDCGKPACPILFPDGTLASFHNSLIQDTSSVTFKDEYGNEKYTLQFDEQDEEKYCRALAWHRYMPSSGLDQDLRFVIYTKDGKKGQPMYDCICPQVAQMSGTQGMTLVYWTNIKKGQTMSTYKKDSIYRIDDSMIEYERFEQVQYKVLLAASIRFEMLSSDFDDKPVLTPICYAINVLGTFDYPISDYASGGGDTYNGMFKIDYETQTDSEGEKTYTVNVFDGFYEYGGGLARINQYEYDVGDYSFQPSGDVEYILLYSYIEGQGAEATPSQPQYIIDTEMPEAEDNECYILLGRVYLDTETNILQIAQESHGIPQGFIFAECQDEPGASDPDEQ